MSYQHQYVDGTRIHFPVGKVVCIGRNYAEHAKELGNEVPTEPLIFLKPPSSLVADGDEVVYPKLSQNLHYEGELGLIIGKRARNVKAEDWRDGGDPNIPIDAAKKKPVLSRTVELEKDK